MQFLKDFLRNLVLLLIIGLVLFIVFPDMMNQVFQLYAAFLGPTALLIVIVIERRISPQVVTSFGILAAA
jgi:hypothetical protein